MMRVAQVIDSLHFVGGAQKMQVVLAQAVCRRGVDLTVLSLEDNSQGSPIPDQLRALGARVLFFPARNMIDPLRIWRIARFLRQESFDVVQASLTHANVVGTLAARLAGVPVITGIRNAHIHQRRFHRLRFGLETLVVRHLADRVIAVGQATAEAHRERLRGQPIVPIANAVAIPPLADPVDRQQTRLSLTGDPSRPLLISVGRLVEQKGYDDLLAAFAAVRQRHPKAALVIAGSGRLRPQLEAQISDLDLDGHAILLGPRTDVPRLLAASDIFVSSSLWEGMSNALLEAMATGLAVVATSVSDTPGVVVEGTGLLVLPQAPAQLAQAINHLLDDPAQMRAMGQAARAHVARHHDPVAWSEQMLNLFMETAKGGIILCESP